MSGLTYRLHGLTVRSDRALAGVRAAAPDAPVDVTILHRTAIELPEAVRLTCDEERRQVRLAIPQVGWFDVTAEAITAQVAEGPVAQTYLLGSAFAVLLYLRDLLPLHGAALAREGQAVVLLAQSGGGKSTLAAWLARAGWALLADDVVAVSGSGDAAIVASGLARVRLCDDAWEQAERPAAERIVLPDGRAKRVVPAEPAGQDAKLAAVVVLDQGDLGIEPMSSAQLLPELVRHSFRGAVVPLLGRTRGHFDNCVRLAGQVEGLRFRRPLCWDTMAADAAVLDARLRAL